MTDPDSVAVLSRCLHLVECPPKRTPWSEAHRVVHEKRAQKLLLCLADAGREIARKES